MDRNEPARKPFTTITPDKKRQNHRPRELEGFAERHSELDFETSGAERMSEMKDHYIFPSIFNYADDGISVSFPDLPGCYTCGKSDEEAVRMARDALGLHLYGMEEDGDFIPDPAQGRNIRTSPNDRIFLVDVWMPQVRKEVQPLCVLKRSA